jgi:hypothetical protein
MQTRPSGSHGADAQLQRAIVLALLSTEGRRRRSAAELAAELQEGEHDVAAAVGALAHLGVVWSAAGQVWASPAARHLDELELLAI